MYSVYLIEALLTQNLNSLSVHISKRCEMGRPKQSFRIALSDGSNLSLAIFATRNDPVAEVISVQITRLVNDNWVTDARLAVYRSPEGYYSQLPDREKPAR